MLKQIQEDDTNDYRRKFKKSMGKIYSKEFEFDNKMNMEDFTRKRKIDFKDIILFELGTSKRTIALEIEDYIKINSSKEFFTKQAFSEARQKVNPKALEELNEVIVEGTYENEYKTYNGFTLLSIDGSTVQLPNTERLKKEYGRSHCFDCNASL